MRLEDFGVILLGIDTGGTFTDFIYRDNGDDCSWAVYKIPSTPGNPARAVLEGIRHIAGGRKVRVVHGSTVATNAILEGKGALTALITNEGFEDILEIGRQNRTALYDLSYRRPSPIIRKDMRFGIRCRVSRTGEMLQDLEDGDLERLAARLGNAKVESIAVSFLFSFKNPLHEERVRDALSELDVPISLSHEILSEFREFERTSTTALNAYVSPKMQTYIHNLAEGIGEDNLSIMQSNGGSISAGTAMRESVRTILSGPAGGAVGAYEVGKSAGFERLITFDMGGTSTDVSLLDGKLPLTTEAYIGPYPVKVPMIDIHTVGAGGGSIAFVDSGGSLVVGPESAGADPGPVCYGKGKRITVTDANLYLGRIVPGSFLGGNMKIYEDRIIPFFKDMSEAIGLTGIELAEGILSVANTAMERAIRVISVEKGFDPRAFTLFSFGGAGSMHAAFLAGLLEIPKVLVPRNPGILSASGMVMADVIKDYSLTVMTDPHASGREGIAELFSALESQGLDDLALEGIDPGSMIMERSLDMRYKGQSYEITVPLVDDYVEAFHLLHERLYGHCDRDRLVEIVNVRLRARGLPARPGLEKQPGSGPALHPDAVLGEKSVTFDGESFTTRILSRERLHPRNVVEGPALLVEYSSTIVIPPTADGTVDEFGNLLIRPATYGSSTGRTP